MKNKYLIVAIGFFILLVIDSYYFFKFDKDQEADQKELILQQTRFIGAQIEKTISNYQNDLTKILYDNSRYLPEIFSDKRVLNEVSNNLKNFYSRY